MSADARAEVTEAREATPGGDGPQAEAGVARSLARAVSRVAWVARTELHTLLRSPVIYVIGALFLIVQGTSFSALIAAMSDPARPAPLGAVLEAQLGGTVLGWALLLMVLALLGMRVIAEPMRSGEWESLLSCGVSERAAVLGKYVASTLLLALLWLPTTSYLLVISRYQSGGGGWDGPSLVSGYLGVLALGAALLSLAFAASAVTSSSLVAAALGYLAGLVLLLAGEVATIAPELTQDSPRLAAISAALSLRLHAAALARGEVTAGALALWLSVTAVGLSAAVTLTTRGRRRKAEVATRALATGLLALGGVLALALAARGALAWDVSARRRNTLADATLAVLAEATAPVEIVIVEPTLGALRPLFSHAEPVLARMRRRQPLLSVSSLDPAALPGGLAAVAQQAGVAAQDLAGSGAIIVRVGARQRVIDFFEISELAESEAGPAVLRWSVERAVAGRLAELLRPAPVTVCHSEGHGELPLAVAAGEASGSASAAASAPPQLDLAALRARAHDDGVRFLPLPDGAVPSACHVVLVAAPGRPLPPAQALELAQFVERGGGLVVGLASRALDPAGQPLATGLELLLAAAGLGAPPAVAMDPDAALGAGALRVLQGYAAHELNRGFSRVRATVWWTPRALEVTAPAQALISASATSWGETDLAGAAPARDDRDLPGPVVLAAALDRADRGRVVVVGSMESAASAVLAGGGSALDLWLVRALRWAARRPLPAVPVPEVTPDQVRLTMTRGERRAITLLCAAVLPGLWLGVGLGLGAWRRRRR